MGISINIGGNLQNLIVNGSPAQRVVVDGVEVWSAGPVRTPSVFNFTYEEPKTQNLYLTQSAPGAVTVDWGDGSTPESPSSLSANLSHDYTAGTYPVTVSCKAGETWYPGNTAYMFTGSGQVAKTGLRRAQFGAGVYELPAVGPSTGMGAMENETYLAQVIISDEIQTIGNRTFKNCTRLNDIRIGTGITTAFGNDAFNAAGSGSSYVDIYLKDIAAFASIPGNTNNTKAEPFSGGTKPKAILMNEVPITHLAIPNTVVEVPKYRFGYLKDVSTIEINAQKINGKSFIKASALTKVWIRSNVLTIASSSATDGPFYQCPAGLQIYCEADEKPAGWDDYWNNYGSSNKYTPIWSQKTSPF